jgi:hypothetical protein
MVLLTVVAHQVDTEAHHTIPPGWRWCVMLGGEPWEDESRMLNAGWCPNRNEALVEGEAVGVAVGKALHALGHPVDYQVRELDHDPIPMGV